MTTFSLLEDAMLELDFAEELDAIELLDLTEELEAIELEDLGALLEEDTAELEEDLGALLEDAMLELDFTEELDAIELLDLTEELEAIELEDDFGALLVEDFTEEELAGDGTGLIAMPEQRTSST